MSLEKDQQAVAELDRTRKEVLAQANKDSEQQLQLNPQLTPQEALLQLIAQVASSVRQQQLKTEQTIQQTLQQASAALSDAQILMPSLRRYKHCSRLSLREAAVHSIISRHCSSSGKVQQQLRQSADQLTQTFQQTVSSMAQAQLLI